MASKFKPFRLGKKRDLDLERKRIKVMTANEFVNIRDVQDCVMYGKDNNIFAYIRIQPISLELLSKSEQIQKIMILSSEFSAQKQPYKIFSIPRPVDVSYMLNKLSTLREETTDTIQRELLSDELKELSDYATSGEINERQFYMILWEENKKDGERELLKRANDIVYKFNNCNIKVSLCKRVEIIKFFNLFANPNYAHLENGDFEEHIPFVH